MYRFLLENVKGLDCKSRGFRLAETKPGLMVAISMSHVHQQPAQTLRISIMRPGSGIMMWAALLSMLLRFVSCADSEQVPLATTPSRPNILFVLTDDQDAVMDSLSYMPLLQKRVADHGTSFTRHYCTVALCCPSRVSMWTGKAAHNTNVTDVNPPHGGYPKFISQGFNEAYLPIWLQEAGYATYYVGKLFNAQTIYNYHSPHVAGWTGSDFLLDPFTYRYLNNTFQRNHDPPVSYEGHYSTDVISDKAHGFLDDALEGLKQGGKPFFLTVAPIAPHSNVDIKQKVIHGNFSRNSAVQTPPISAERHKHLFEDVVVPRTPHFNPDIPGAASWLRLLPKQGPKNIAYNDEFYRGRLRSLQAVDEMVDSLVEKLEEAGVIDNTYIFYSTDNGYHIGQHRLQPGKQCAYEEDINIPLIVRGPGIAKGVVTDIVTSHTDMAPTFLTLAGVPIKEEFRFDGQAIPLTAPESSIVASGDAGNLKSVRAWRQEHVNVEMWGINMSEGKYFNFLFPNHTYKALRVIGEDYSLLYTVWCSNERELYDLKTDPYEMDNLYAGDLSAVFGLQTTAVDAEVNRSIPILESISATSMSTDNSTTSRNEDPTTRRVYHVLHRLDSLLMVLKTCKERQCMHPWESIHPDGVVASFRDALSPEYDSFYEQSFLNAKVQYQNCERGYIPESEQPVWDDGMAYGMFEEMALD